MGASATSGDPVEAKDDVKRRFREALDRKQGRAADGAATGESGREGDILRAVIWHSLALALLVGGIVWLYAHVAPGLVPLPPTR